MSGNRVMPHFKQHLHYSYPIPKRTMNSEPINPVTPIIYNLSSSSKLLRGCFCGIQISCLNDRSLLMLNICHWLVWAAEILFTDLILISWLIWWRPVVLGGIMYRTIWMYPWLIGLPCCLSGFPIVWSVKINREPKQILLILPLLMVIKHHTTKNKNL